MSRMGLVAIGVVLVVAACSSDDAGDNGSGDNGSGDNGSGDATTTTTGAATTADPGTDTTEPAGADAPELGGTSWNVTMYQLVASGSMTNLWPGTEITIAFGDDGTFSGNAGCNDYSGVYEVTGAYDEFETGIRDENDGQAMTLTDLSYTEMACTEPNNVMEQEVEFLAVLPEVGRWVIVRDNNLSLRTPDGLFLLQGEPIA